MSRKNQMNWYNDNTTPITPSTGVAESQMVGVEMPPADYTAPSTVTSTPTPASTEGGNKPATNAGQAILNFLSNPSYMQSIGTGVNTVLGAAGQIQNLAHGGGNQPPAPIGGGGQGQGGGGGNKPKNQSNTILGMSPTVFYVGVGFVVILAGVGIFMATRGGDSSAPAGK